MKALLSYIIVVSFFYISFSACNRQEKKQNQTTFQKEMDSLQMQQLNDFIIEENRVGIIKNGDSLEDIYKKFGKEHITQDSFFLEGMFQNMVHVLDSGKNQELILHFNKDKKVSYIQIKHPKSSYHYMNGFSVGTSLAELVSFNKQPIDFYGFGWDNYGRIVSTSGGEISKKLPHFSGVLIPKDNVAAISTKYIGDATYSSSKLTPEEQKAILIEELDITFNAGKKVDQE